MPRATLVKLKVEGVGYPVDSATCTCGALHVFDGDAHRDAYTCEVCHEVVFVSPVDNSIPRTPKNIAWIKDKLQAFAQVYGFPKNEQGLTMYCEEFLKIVHDEARGEWLLNELKKLEMRRFPMPIVLRRIYDARWTPADGIKPNETIASKIEAEY